MDKIIVGTNLQDIGDGDTLEQVLRKIASNQKTLFEQIIEIVNFYNATYKTDDNTADANVTVNVGSIKSVCLKYGIVYVNYIGEDGTPEVIKFRLNNASSSSTSTEKDSNICIVNYFDNDGNISQVPDNANGTYACMGGHFYKKDITGWTLVDDAYDGVYFIHNNALYKFNKATGTRLLLSGVSPDTLSNYATVEGVTEGFSELEDTIKKLYNRIIPLKACNLSGEVDRSNLEENDYFIENGILLQHTALGPGKEVSINMDKAFFLYDHELFSIKNGSKEVHISNVDATVLEALKTKVNTLTKKVDDIIVERTYVIEVKDLLSMLNYNGTVYNINRYSVGDLLLMSDINKQEMHLLIVKGPTLHVEEINLKTFAIEDYEVLYSCYGGLWRINDAFDYEKVTVNESDDFIIRTGMAVTDTAQDVIHVEEPYEDGNGNKVQTVLCLEDNKIYRFSYFSDGITGSYYEYDAVNKNHLGGVLFIDVYNKVIYYRHRPFDSKVPGVWDIPAGVYTPIFDCSWRNNIPVSGYTNNNDFVTVGGVARELKNKANVNSPALTGTPTAPTASSGTNSNQIATTKFVAEAIAAAMLSQSDVDLSGVLNDIETLFDTKAEFLVVKYLVDDLESITSPYNGAKAIYASEPEDPILYVYSNGSWVEQSAEVNAHLKDSSVIVVCDDKLWRWNDDTDSFDVLLHTVADQALSTTSNKPIANRVVTLALNNKANVSDVNLKAPLASPAFTGSPTSTTPAISDSSNKIATTQFVKNVLQTLGQGTTIVRADDWVFNQEEVYVDNYNAVVYISNDDVILYTKHDENIEAQSIDDYDETILNTTNLYLINDKGFYVYENDTFKCLLDNETLIAISPSSNKPVASGALKVALDKKANLNSPGFTGTPTAPTVDVSDNSDTIATTKFVRNYVDSVRGNIPIAIETDPQHEGYDNTNTGEYEDDDDVTTPEVKTFNTLTGNPGVIALNKAPEDIVAEDVDETAFPLPTLYKNVTVGKSVTVQSIWTAAEVGLQAGSSDAIKRANTAAFIAAMNDDLCVGIKLDAVYEFYIKNQGGSGIPKGTVDDPRRLWITKPFIIDGDVDGQAVGGFKVASELFYIESSVVFNKVHFISSIASGYFVNWINCEYGIDVVKIKDCVFENNVDDRRWFWLRFKNASPFASEGDWSTPTSDNYLNHLYIEGCTTASKYEFIAATWKRIDKSCRILNNTFTDLYGACGISLTTDANTNANYAGYMECPYYIIGNTFRGRNVVVRTGSMYYNAVCVETNTAYILHNTIERLVSGRLKRTRVSDGYVYDKGSATTDVYFAGFKFYYCNNNVKNVLCLDPVLNECGYLKAKGLITGKPTLLTHSSIMHPVRYFKGNTYTLNKSEIEEIWNNRVQPVNTSTWNYDILSTYESQLDIENALSFSVCSIIFGVFDNQCIALEEYVFSNNTINIPDGYLKGPGSGTATSTNKFICENNIFNTKEGTKGSDNLFVMYLAHEWSGVDTEFKVNNNRFSATTTPIRLALIKYSTKDDRVSTPQADVVEFNNNVTPTNKKVIVNTTNISTWTIVNYLSN